MGCHCGKCLHRHRNKHAIFSLGKQAFAVQNTVTEVVPGSVVRAEDPAGSKLYCLILLFSVSCLWRHRSMRITLIP